MAKYYFFASVLLIVFLGASTKDTKKVHDIKLNADDRACLKETSLTETELREYLKNNQNNTSTEASTEEPESILCFFKCIGTKTGVFDEKGNVNISKARQNLDEMKEQISEKSKHEMVECLKKTGKIVTCKDLTKYIECTS